MRHRLDLAKLYLGKDGGYSLRKFKRIFKREMAEHPEKYIIMRPGTKFEKYTKGKTIDILAGDFVEDKVKSEGREDGEDGKD